MTLRPARRVRLGIGAVAVLAVLTPLGWLLWPRPPAPTVLYAGTAHYTATITVAQPQAGTADVTVMLATRTGAPAGDAKIVLAATMPLMGLATPSITITPWGTGRYDAFDVPLMMTGPWLLRLSITAPTGATDELDLPLTVTR